MSKKTYAISCSKLLYKMGQDFLDRQYDRGVTNHVLNTIFPINLVFFVTRSYVSLYLKYIYDLIVLIVLIFLRLFSIV